MYEERGASSHVTVFKLSPKMSSHQVSFAITELSFRNKTFDGKQVTQIRLCFLLASVKNALLTYQSYKLPEAEFRKESRSSSYSFLLVHFSQMKETD